MLVCSKEEINIVNSFLSINHARFAVEALLFSVRSAERNQHLDTLLSRILVIVLESDTGADFSLGDLIPHHAEAKIVCLEEQVGELLTDAFRVEARVRQVKLIKRIAASAILDRSEDTLDLPSCKLVVIEDDTL